MKLKYSITALGLMVAGWFIPAQAYDYGYTQQYVFFQEHMDQVWKLWEDIGGSRERDTQYALYDFDHDGKAELYLYGTYGRLSAILCCGSGRVDMVAHADYKNWVFTYDGHDFQYTASVMGANYSYYSTLRNSIVVNHPFMSVQTADDDEPVLKSRAGATFHRASAEKWVSIMNFHLNTGEGLPTQLNGTSPIALLAGLPLRRSMPDEVDHEHPALIDVPSFWYLRSTAAVPVMNVQNAFSAIVRTLNVGDLNYMLQQLTSTNRPDYIKVINDSRNGFLQIKSEGQWDNVVECCYWNLPSGQKLVALYFHYFFESLEVMANGLNCMLWYQYDPATKQMSPMLEPPYHGRFPDISRYELQLPRQGKDIRLMERDELMGVLHWNGDGFDLMMDLNAPE